MRITEIFFSVQGESSYAGLPCVFVRLTWCNLRCTWCDSEYTFKGGEEMSVDEVIERVGSYGCRLVEITGGEPLVQKKECTELAKRLCDLGYQVLIETSGSLDTSPLDPRAALILDVKCPGSGEVERNYWPNLDRLKHQDQVKFVINGKEDFDYAVDIVRKHGLAEKGIELLVSPVWGKVELKEMAAWVLTSGINFRFQLQLHKLIWGPDVTGV